MTAAEILDKLLGELDDLLDPGPHERGNCPIAEANDGVCERCDLSDQIRGIADAARMERDRARLIFGEAA